ncbi:MAG: twin-arginine translocation signal domain-containing protein [Acidobacteria bacterium]|nr:twin-arginine translocation signal domain-containing protein [Acidobacteriota bacterium]MCI0720038.1 twin-arginine translocation signal domain-containing protein [Acidobacteriota bacterium]
MNRRNFLQGSASLTAFAGIGAPQLAGQKTGKTASKEIQLTATEPGGAERRGFPLTVGVPFAKGILPKGHSVAILDSKGTPQPLQTRVTETHADGSVRWLLLDYQADFKPFGTTRSSLVLGRKSPEPLSGNRIETQEAGDLMSVNNGVLKVELNRKRCLPLVRVWRNGQLISEGGLDFWVTASNGKKFSVQNDSAASFNIEESGPLRLLVSWKGTHKDFAGEKHFDFWIRLTIYAGSPFLRLDDVFYNRLDADETSVQEISVRFPLQLTGPLTYRVGERYRPGPGQPSVVFKADEPVRLEEYKLGDFHIVNEAGKIIRDADIPPKNPFMPNASMGWVNVNGQGQGVMLVGKNFWQNYPKAIAANSKGIQHDLIPKQGKQFPVPRGMAKTHTFFLAFHDGKAEERDLVDLAFTVQRWPMPAAPAEYYWESGELWDFFPYYPEKYPRLEGAFAQLFEPDRNHLPRITSGSGRAYGLKHYGDFVAMGKNIKSPDPDEPDVFYLNNEYDTAHVLAMMFLRDQDIAKWWVAEAHALHMMDIDTCHHAIPVRSDSKDDPRAEADSESESSTDTSLPAVLDARFMMGAQYRHCNQHISKSPRNPDHSHVFGEGLLDYYHLTGDRQALEVVTGYAKNLAYRTNNFKRYVFGIGRGAGWSLLTLGGVYNVQPDPEIHRAANSMIDKIISQKGPDGIILDSNNHPQAWEDRKYTLCMRGLIEWHRATGDPKTRTLILDMMNAFIRIAIGRDGMPRAGNWPERSKPTTASQGFANLEALAYAYDLSGDRKYINAGIGGLCHVVDWVTHPQEESQHVFFHRILRGPFRFMAIADKLGILEKVPGTGSWLMS